MALGFFQGGIGARSEQMRASAQLPKPVDRLDAYEDGALWIDERRSL